MQQYFAPEEQNGEWVVKLILVNGNEKLHKFNTQQEANQFIMDELAAYVETGLTKTQQMFVLSAWDKVTFDELTKTAFDDPTIDGRSKQGRAIKKFLASRQIVPKPGYTVRLPDRELTDKDKDYIKTHAATHSSLEMAREVFGDPTIKQLSKEHRAVDAYVKTLDGKVLGIPASLGRIATETYKPPKTLAGTVDRVNKYSHVQLDKDKLSAIHKKGLEALTSHLNSPRFQRTINAYNDEQDRDSFESEFIRSTWDKPDLTVEDVNLYINLCADYIMMFKIQHQIEALNSRMNEVMDDPKGEITMRLTEAISVKVKEYDSCFERHRKLAENLSSKRSDRLKKEIRDNASVLMLVQAWKTEEERLQLIRMAQAKEQEVEGEIKRLESMSELKARILGIGTQEALHGL